MSTHSCAVRVATFSNGSITIGFKFTELHILTLAACSYVLLIHIIVGPANNNVTLRSGQRLQKLLQNHYHKAGALIQYQENSREACLLKDNC